MTALGQGLMSTAVLLRRWPLVSYPSSPLPRSPVPASLSHLQLWEIAGGESDPKWGLSAAVKGPAGPAPFVAPLSIAEQKKKLLWGKKADPMHPNVSRYCTCSLPE